MLSRWLNKVIEAGWTACSNWKDETRCPQFQLASRVIEHCEKPRKRERVTNVEQVNS